ncbi:olfactory receptor 6C74-like [Hyperolius riggenbachi]|uniref:olfactory receptor 6C74-like n=1 Tax=Hyperolius riggenbachi TaxID=752182 RepID=UPI0035A34DB4
MFALEMEQLQPAETSSLCFNIIKHKLPMSRSRMDLFEQTLDISQYAGLQNRTPITYFIINGISNIPQLQTLLFFLVLLIYLITVSGNSSILLLVCLDPQLHTPMYFFLGNLSFLDIFCLTITLHKIILSYVSGDKTVSFSNCMSQMYLFSTLTCSELLLLAAMGYDRYVAICSPLHYHMLMDKKMCIILAMVCWMLGFIEVIPHMWQISQFSCFKSNEINHYFCDILPIMKLSCNDTTLLKRIIFIEGLLLVSFTPFLLTFISYIFIISTILKIRTSTGRRKAFYTCSSHLTVVIILYLSLVSQYLRPSSTDTLDSNKLFSLFNTAAVPVLNPFIYSLKNKDVKSAAKRQLRWTTKY